MEYIEYIRIMEHIKNLENYINSYINVLREGKDFPRDINWFRNNIPDLIDKENINPKMFKYTLENLRN